MPVLDVWHHSHDYDGIYKVNIFSLPMYMSPLIQNFLGKIKKKDSPIVSR